MAIKDFYPTITPSLNLDFADGKSVDPRITFSRASTASYTDSKGILRYAPTNNPRLDYDPVTGECKGLIIEEARTNLLQYSSNFDNAYWALTRATIKPNATIAPDGTLSANKMIESIDNNTHNFYVQVGGVTNGGTYTFSVYAKAAERSIINLTLRNSTWGYLTSATYNLTNQNITITAGTPTTSIVSIGNGWYRLSISGVTNDTTCGPLIVTSDGTNLSYAGDGVSGVYIWGAQLEAGSFATSYIPSNNTFTSRASTATYVGSNGLIKTAAINTPRLNYNPTNLSISPQLLLEAASTNLLTYSEQFDNAAWTKTRSTITSNTIIAPDGLQTADKLIEDSSVGTHYCRNGANLIANTTYTISVYAKAAERSLFYIGIGTSTGWATSGGASFDLLSGSITVSNSDVIAKTTYVGNGWYLCSLTKLKNSVDSLTTFDINLLDISSGNGSYTGDGVSGIYVWGAQLEALPYATSYIATTSAAVTRSADVSTSAQTTRASEVAKMDGKNFTSWYNKSEGSFLVEGDSMGSTNRNITALFLTVSNPTNNYAPVIGIMANDITGVNRINGDIWGDDLTAQLNGVYSPTSSYTFGTNVKAMLAYKTNDVQLAVNGSTVGVNDTSVVIPTNVDKLYIGQYYTASNRPLNGHIKRISYYPTRLSNTQLQYLTK